MLLHHLRLPAVGLLAAAGLLGLTTVQARPRAGAPLAVVPANAISDTLVINEVDYDQPGTDYDEFIEIKNVSGGSVNLDGYYVVLVNGGATPGTEYDRVDLPSVSLPPGGRFVVCGGATATPGIPRVSNCDLPWFRTSNWIENGAPDGIAVVANPTLTFGTATPNASQRATLAVSDDMVDALSYEGHTSGGPVTGGTWTEGTGVPGSGDTASAATITPSGPALDANKGFSRPDETGTPDTDNNSSDFSLRCTSPGQRNVASASDCPDTLTNTPTDAPGTGTATATDLPTLTPTPTDPVTATATEPATETASPAATSTDPPAPTDTATASATAVPSDTPVPTVTDTVEPTETPSPPPTATDTVTPPPTDTPPPPPTHTPTTEPTATATDPPSPTATATNVASPAASPVPTDTASPPASATPAVTDTPAPTTTAAPPTTATPIHLPIQLVHFGARRVGRAVFLSWATASEIKHAGFRVWRVPAWPGAPTPVAAGLIPARGGELDGATYRLVDWAAPRPAVRYWLEAVSTTGTSTRHGPALAGPAPRRPIDPPGPRYPRTDTAWEAQ